MEFLASISKEIMLHPSSLHSMLWSVESYVFLLQEQNILGLRFLQRK